MDAASTGNSDALATEITNRANADDSIKANLALETANRIDSEATIKADLASESARATTSENSLAANLATETTNRAASEATINSDLTSEVSRATAAENNLSATKEDVANKSTNIATDAASDTKYPSVKSVKDYVDAASTGSSDALATEITNRANADDSIIANLATETANRIDSEATIKTNLNSEISRATTSENTLAGNLATETTNRSEADATITSDLNSEVTRATNAEATKEDVANKSTDITTDAASDTKYPSVKSVKDYVDAASTGSSDALAYRNYQSCKCGRFY